MEDDVDFFWPLWLQSTKAWTLSTTQASSWICIYAIGLVQMLFWDFCKMLQENLNELSGQPNT